ncbi:MAG: hypothetical protein FD145_931 [Candidatus Saganbacteria bacterium]|uniref:Uncharacterized protein n=1 Tax=Candidatus Saganbacteria bacterium TaxID=2575572 RepID=A0A833L0X1_UNCSA|nr:MAG: hypothetical protein FD145_931 [Candidatus Saganbacteria bacterium]
MITEKDIIKMKNVFATKEELNNGLAGLEKKFDIRFDKVSIMLDKIMGELEKAREDRIFAKAKDDEQDQKICVIESRVRKIEEKISV